MNSSSWQKKKPERPRWSRSATSKTSDRWTSRPISWFTNASEEKPRRRQHAASREWICSSTCSSQRSSPSSSSSVIAAPNHQYQTQVSSKASWSQSIVQLFPLVVVFELSFCQLEKAANVKVQSHLITLSFTWVERRTTVQQLAHKTTNRTLNESSRRWLINVHN